MSDPRDYKVELSGVGDDGAADARATVSRDAETSAVAARPYLSVLFACCGVYQRVYRDADGKMYRGRCPRCGGGVRFVVGGEGTSARRFVVR